MDKQTSLSIDYAKAIGISLVVIGHTAWKPFQTLDPYYFHMPLFFFIGGFLCSGRKTIINVAKDTFFKYILYTAFTYAIVAIIAFSIKYTFNAPVNVGIPFAGNILNTIKIALKSNFHNNLYFLVGWFLLAYGISSFILNCYLKITSAIRNENLKTLLSIASIGLALLSASLISANKEYHWSQSLNLTTQVLIALSFMILGNMARKHKIKFNDIYVAIVLFLFICLMLSNNLYTLPVMSLSIYRSGVFLFFVGATAAIYVVMFVSGCVAAACVEKRITLLSTYSKGIMSYHLVFFLFLDAISYKFFNYNIELATPTKHYYTASSWIFYIILPLVLIPLISIYADRIKGLARSLISKLAYNIW